MEGLISALTIMAYLVIGVIVLVVAIWVIMAIRFRRVVSDAYAEVQKDRNEFDDKMRNRMM